MATDYNDLLRALAGFEWVPSVVLSGTARGADRLGELWADADALLALWDGKSCGTKHMIDLAAKHGLTVSVFRTDLGVVSRQEPAPCDSSPR